MEKCARIVQVCMSLHNFIVDSREDKADKGHFEQFTMAHDTVQNRLTKQTGEVPVALVTDNNEPRSRGRPTAEEAQLRAEGDSIRHQLKLTSLV